MSNETLKKSLGRLSQLKFFPTNEFAQQDIVETIQELCSTDAKAIKLVDLILESYDEWPGPATIRSTYESRVADKKTFGPGCEKCDDGFGSAFLIRRRLPDGSMHERTIYNEVKRAACTDKAREERARCLAADEEFYELVYFCSCPLGRDKKAASDALGSGTRKS